MFLAPSKKLCFEGPFRFHNPHIMRMGWEVSGPFVASNPHICICIYIHILIGTMSLAKSNSICQIDVSSERDVLPLWCCSQDGCKKLTYCHPGSVSAPSFTLASARGAWWGIREGSTPHSRYVWELPLYLMWCMALAELPLYLMWCIVSYLTTLCGALPGREPPLYPMWCIWVRSYHSTLSNAYGWKNYHI